ncbi:alpha-L-rhamnosidase-related protein [Puniceicoccus vermicola]|uniref:Alpha-L-rhamnosidase N-terminal domain-containing protein n=1 Tax=Puniceicoccus vermicola TaxID=388746 RepID=A0A7X1AVK6_9BACT|nr:alpha-L-rhamnosidase C-terminal domain-containing protein [Puniceicoccus vermicola]MBC2600803.1 alpha-L-rhamnosidase N-terminal domain-containing protein [Puniceicoccus vermicola]
MNFPDSALPEIPAILQRARWIWPDNPHWDLHNCYALFRKNFLLKEVPSTAPLFITADQSYQLFINGKYVCRGPARGYQRSWPYDEIDVAPWLHRGENLIAIRAHNPGFSTFQYLHQGYAGLLVAAEWGATTILTDSSWKSRRQTGLKRDMIQTSLQLFPQENIDLRKEDPSWNRPDYDDLEWTANTVETTRNGLPWTSLEPRDIPMLDESVIPAGRVIGTARGESLSNYRTSRNLTETRFNEGLNHQPLDLSADEINIDASTSGQWQSYLIDLGKTQVGCLLLEVEGARGDEVVETHHFETIDPSSLCPDFKPDAHCRMAFSHRLTCREGANEHHFFHPFGFRYMVLTVRDNLGPITIRPSLRSALYPLEIKGSFQSDDTLLNEIWSTSAWTQRICSMDAYVDTPWREQAQWWGDARVQSWNTFHLSGDPRLLKRGIRQIAGQTTPDGLTYGHAPTVAHGCVLPDFTLIWILTLWDYYWQTGSMEAFQKHHAVIQNALNYFETWTDNETGLLRYDPRYWLFLDWTEIPKEGCSSLYSLWYLYALEKLATMYSITDNESHASKCQQRANKIRQNLRALLNEEGFVIGGYSGDGQRVPTTTVHAQTLAILNHLSPQSEEAMISQILLPYLRGELTTTAHPSAYWITYVYSLLGERGYGKEVIAHIREHWAPMVSHGTTWENFQPVKAEESFSHAWSAHPLFHFMQILGGIRQTAPGWKEISFEPTIQGDSAQTTIPTPRGKIHSEWHRKGDTIQGSLELPKGMQAQIILPGSPAEMVSGRYSFEIKV